MSLRRIRHFPCGRTIVELAAPGHFSDETGLLRTDTQAYASVSSSKIILDTPNDPGVTIHKFRDDLTFGLWLIGTKYNAALSTQPQQPTKDW